MALNPFADLMTDIVRLEKSDGQVFENISSHVQSKMIFISDASLPIEEEDILIQTLPNGLEVKFIVTDRGYHNKFHDIPAGYQCKVEKLTMYNKKNTPTTQTTTYNLHGPNSRVNNNSTDNSTNTTNIGLTPQNIFEELRKTIALELPPERQLELVSTVNEMEREKGNPTFMDKYMKFMTIASDHITVFTPFMPMLASFLTR